MALILIRERSSCPSRRAEMGGGLDDHILTPHMEREITDWAHTLDGLWGQGTSVPKGLVCEGSVYLSWTSKSGMRNWRAGELIPHENSSKVQPKDTLTDSRSSFFPRRTSASRPGPYLALTSDLAHQDRGAGEMIYVHALRITSVVSGEGRVKRERATTSSPHQCD